MKPRTMAWVGHLALRRKMENVKVQNFNRKTSRQYCTF